MASKGQSVSKQPLFEQRTINKPLKDTVSSVSDSHCPISLVRRGTKSQPGSGISGGCLGVYPPISLPTHEAALRDVDLRWLFSV